jgi:D-alanyl-D-alanine carboxypeptidase
MKNISALAASATLMATIFLGTPTEVKALSLENNSSNTLFPFPDTDLIEKPRGRLIKKELQNTLDYIVEKNGIPGASIGIITPAGRWFGASGFSNLEAQTPMKPNDVFGIGSITKTFTATTMLKLQEEGVLSLDDTLGQWLPDIASNIPDGSSITIRQLLNGSSGIADAVLAWAEDIKADPTILFEDWQPEDIVAYAYGQERQAWEYPNAGFLLAGLIVEEATGSSYASVINEKIVEPLGLKKTFLGTEENPRKLVSSYLDFDEDGNLDNITEFDRLFIKAGAGAGSIYSNTRNLAIFADALFSGDLLSPESYAEMYDFVDTGIPGLNYGLGLEKLDVGIPGISWIGHNGLTLGYSSNLFYSPELDITIVTLQNNQDLENAIGGFLDATLLAPLTTTLLESGVVGLTSVPEPNTIGGVIALGIFGFLAKSKNWCRR